MKSTWTRLATVGAAFLAGGVVALAAFDPPKDKPAQPDPKAEMDAWIKLGQPGEQHKMLDQFVGTWDAQCSFMMGGPNDPPEKSTGSMVNSWVLDGRYLRQEFSGTSMGQPFKGIGYWGYDNIEKQSISTWMDSMSTGIMFSKGSYAPDQKAWNFVSEMKDPSGATIRHRMVIKVTDRDHHTLEMFMTGPDGKEMKGGEINYSRKK